MSAVEDRIIAMKFDNTQFDTKVKSSMSVLDRLKAALNLTGAGKGLNDLQNTASHFSLAGVTNGVAQVGSKFSAMSVVAISAIASIVNKAVDAGIRVVKAFALEPIKAGFESYTEQINATQVILANTASQGTKLKDVTRVLKELQDYANQTVYSFADMTSNIGRFTAAGVPLEKATAAIKGMSNVAALSGANTQQLSSAMYQMSQALSTGTIKLQDWNSLSNANMAGSNVQQALEETARTMGDNGKLMDSSIKKYGNFRNSLTSGWLTADIFSKAMKVMGGTIDESTGKMRAFSTSELEQMGYTKKQAKGLHDLSQAALDSAIKIRTLPQLTQALKEEVATAWGSVFKTIFGDINEATKLFTEFHTFAENALTTPVNNLNKLLQAFVKLGGRENIIKALVNAFKGLQSVLKPIKDAFRQIFPPVTAKQLFDLSQNFLEFTKSLKIGGETAKNLKRTFAGVFAVFDIGWQAVKVLLKVLGELFSLIGKGSGGFLNFTGNIGDFLVSLDKAIKKGDLFNKFIKQLADIIKHPINSIKQLASAIYDFFSNLINNPADAVGKSFGRLGDRLKPLAGIGKLVAAAFGGLVKFLGKAGKYIQPFMDVLGSAFGKIGDTLASAIKSGDFSGVFDALNAGLFSGLILVIRHFFKKGLNVDFSGGLFKGIKETFESLTGVLTSLQTNIKADTLMKIAVAVAVLTASIVALSMIDSKKLAKAMTAISGAFAQLLGAMAILTSITKSAGFIKIPIIAASMVTLSIAVLILSAAVKNLSDLNWEDLSKGLLGVAAILGMIVLTSMGLDKANGPMLRAGLALIPFALGLKILASAVKDFGKMSWGDLVKGITGMAGAIGGIGLALRLMPKNMPITATQLLIVAAAMKVLASAVKSFSDISWGSLLQGLAGMAGSLGVLAGALRLMPKDTGAKAVGLLILAAAIKVMASAMTDLGGMSWQDIAQGLTALAGAMGIMVVALNAMKGTVAGSAALTLAAVALALLTPVIATLGSMDLTTLAIGLGAIAAVFLILGVAGAALSEVSPIILALAISIGILGAAVALTGVGLLAMATAFSIFVAAAAAGGGAILTLINLIPAFMAKFAEGIAAFIVSLAANQGKIIAAGVKLVGGLLEAIVKIGPQLSLAMNTLVNMLITIVLQNAPKLANAGLKLVIQLLTAIKNNIGQIVTVGSQAVVNFLNGVAKNIGSVVKAGVNLLVKFMDAVQSQQGKLLDRAAKLIISFVSTLAKTIRSNQSAMNSAARSLASAIISGMTGGLSDMAWKVAQRAASMARDALNAAKHALGINSPSKEFFKVGAWSAEGAANGIDKNASQMSGSATSMGKKALTALRTSMSGSSDILSGTLDFNPVIAPSLDLRNVTANAGKLDTLLANKSIGTTMSLSRAQDIADLFSAIPAPQTSTATSAAPIEVRFEQHLNSPKALSEAEIYMDTKSLLGQLKGALSGVNSR